MSTIIETAEAVRQGRLSAREVVEESLGRIERDNADVNAFVYLDAGSALRAAQKVDEMIARGQDPGPLAGVPFGIKDLRDTCAGMPTGNGSLFHCEDKPALTDSVHIARLKAAGGIPLGKVATAEFGMDGVTNTLAHGVTRNPWNLERTSSGSSGGSSAAVAAGMVPFCTASDGGGSTRCPAGYTGLVGLKPSMGRIPRGDGFNDKTVLGALTTTVSDTARYLDVVSGPDDCDRMTLPASEVCYESLIESTFPSGIKAVWSTDLGFAPLAPDVERVCRKAMGSLVAAAGLQLVDRPVELPNVYMDVNMQLTELFVQGLERRGILPDQIDKLSPGPRYFVERFYREFDPSVRIRAFDKQLELEQGLAAIFQDADVLITPCHSRDAYAAEGPLPESICGMDSSQTHAEPFTMLANICWNPSISVPAGLSDDGLPIGLLITCRRHRDDVALHLARIWEKTQPWPHLAPAFRVEPSTN